jgi:PEP-CTERM motif
MKSLFNWMQFMRAGKARVLNQGVDNTADDQPRRARRHRVPRLAVCGLVVAQFGLLMPIADAAPVFYTDRPTFNADGRVTTTTTINFDSLAPGTDLTGSTLSGVTFNAPGSTPLQVILGSTGVRFPMSPSSGANVLSPGGSNTALENDDLELIFATAVKAAGMDVVFDVPDGASFVGVTFFDASNAVICSTGFIPSPSGAPGFQFVGCVSDSANIKRVAFDEFDGSPPDDHVAYDTLTFSPAIAAPPPSAGVPVPGTLLLFGLGGLVAAGIRSRSKRR